MLLPEQLVSNDDGPGALRRRFTSVDALVYYAPANVDDIVAPRILGTGASSTVSGTTFSVETTDDETGVARVVVLYRSGNKYLPLDLAQVEGTNTWIGAVAGVTDPHFIAQAMDFGGNVGTSSNKAVLYEADGQGSDFGVALDGPVGDNSWFTGTPQASLIGDADPNDVAVSVNGGPSVPFSQFGGLPAADGVYDLTATSSNQTVTLTVPVDSTPPTITTTPTLTVSSVFQVGQAVTVAVTCARSERAEQLRRGELYAGERDARHVVTRHAFVPGDARPTTPGTPNADVHLRRREPVQVHERVPEPEPVERGPRRLVPAADLQGVRAGREPDHVVVGVHDDGVRTPDVSDELVAGSAPAIEHVEPDVELLLLRPDLQELRVGVACTETDPERGQAVLHPHREGHGRHRYGPELVGEADAIILGSAMLRLELLGSAMLRLATRPIGARRRGGRARSARSGDRRGRRRAASRRPRASRRAVRAGSRRRSVR